MAKPTVVLVLHSGGDYRPEHVIRLWSALCDKGQWTGHLVCLTDTVSGWAPAEIELLPLLRGYPGWWSKLELCAPEQDGLGDIFFLDLDTNVVGPVDDLAAVGRLTMLRDFTMPQRLASGVMYLPLDARQACWKTLKLVGAETVMGQYRRRGDQGFFAAAWDGFPMIRWQDVLPDQICSYKVHVRDGGSAPVGVRLVCFHGKPRPWEI